MMMMVAATAAPVAAAITEKKVKATWTTARPAAEVAGCLTGEMSWNGQMSSLPAPGGAQRLQFAFFGQVTTDLLITPGDPTRIELRGMSSKRIRASVARCL
ncbi:hypothetical protein [Sphingomonas paucimobilis]|uniref:hypothetical protein n=1 Tax=Sphingomonas paucimobilis TaxID=13689 RepID=UPI0031DCA863